MILGGNPYATMYGLAGVCRDHVNIGKMGRIDSRSMVKEVADLNPEKFSDCAQWNIERIIYNIETPIDTQLGSKPHDLSIVDLGGNFAMFSAACAKLGLENPVDDYGEPAKLKHGNGLVELHRSLEVAVINMDFALELPVNLPVVDIYTTFDTMEYWYASPKILFRVVAQQMSQGARFVLGILNCVNLRKRPSVPIGGDNWSIMGDWYDKTIFRGRAGEQDLQYLAYIADDLKISARRIVGRNFQGYSHANAFVRFATHYIDKQLSAFLSLCSDFCLVGSK